MTNLLKHTVYPDNEWPRWVIGDVHGCIDTLLALLQQLAVTPDHQVFFLGDYIDRGPDSQAVLDFLRTKQSNGYRFYTLRGNHEEDLLHYANRTGEALMARNFGALQATMLENGQLKAVYRKQIAQMPYLIDTGDYYLVHAGLNFQLENTFTDTYSMLHLRRIVANEDDLHGRRLVHGHDIRPLSEIRTKVQNRASVLPLDNGAVVGNKLSNNELNQYQVGYLCALELNTLQLVTQEYVG